MGHVKFSFHLTIFGYEREGREEEKETKRQTERRANGQTDRDRNIHRGGGSSDKDNKAGMERKEREQINHVNK